MSSADPGPTQAADQLAAQALEAVGANPRRARVLAERAYTAARKERNTGASCIALRAQGLAHRALGDLATSEAKMRAAIRCGTRAGATQPEAEARMSLAFILLERGRISSALGHADRAATNLTGLPAARLIAQRAMILQRCGRLDEALADYARALPILRKHDDGKWEAVLRNNRGLLYGYRGDLAAGERDLQRALELDRAAGRLIDAADVEWNLGFLAARRGDAPTALERYAVAAAAHEAQGTPNPQLLLDRCEVLLSVGLLSEARQTAELAVAACAASGQGSDWAEAQLLSARTALAVEDHDAALVAGRSAERALSRQQRAAWALLARHVQLRAAAAAGSQAVSRRRLNDALSTADALAAAGWRVAELDARLLAARLALALKDHDTSAEQLRRAARAKRSTDLELRSRAWYAEALLRHSRGDDAGAALRAGLRGIERQRTMLGATELRVHIASHGTDLARMGLSLAVKSGSPTSVLAWAERWRAGALHLRPVRPPRDPELAAALAQLRRISAEVDDALLDGERPRGLESRRRELEQQVVRASRSAPGTIGAASLAPPSVTALSAALGSRALVEFAEVDGELVAVTVRGSTCRLFRLGSLSRITTELDSLLFSLRRLAIGFGSARSQALAQATSRGAATRLDAALFGPLQATIEGAELVLVPTGALHAVPWPALPTTDAVPISVAPSSALWLRATKQTEQSERVVLAAGPGLAAADAEIAACAGGYQKSTVLVGADATAAAVLQAVDGARLAHLSAHGRLRTDNPLFSALHLRDGDLTVYDLERLTAAPTTVLLPACQSGVSAVRAGDEVMGLVSALLSLGSRHVVATVIAVPDAPTAELMVGLHRELRAGAAPAVALFAARHRLDRNEPATYAATAGCVGYGG